MGRGWPAWARWLAVLPAAILGAVLVSFPIHWFALGLTGNTPISMIRLDREVTEAVERLLQAFFGPYAFVWAGARVAPTFRVATAIVLTALLGLFVSVMLSLVVPQLSGRFVLDYGVLQALLNALGAIGAIIVIRDGGGWVR